MSQTESIVQPTWTEIAERLNAEYKKLSVFVESLSAFDAPEQKKYVPIEVRVTLSDFKPVLQELQLLLQLDKETWSETSESNHWLERRFDTLLIRRLFEKAQSVYNRCTGDVRSFVPLLAAIDLIARIIVDYDGTDDDPTDVIREREPLEDCNERCHLLFYDFARNLHTVFEYGKSPAGSSADFQNLMGECDTVCDLIDHVKELQRKLNVNKSDAAMRNNDAYQVGSLITVNWALLRASSVSPYRDVTWGARDHLSRMVTLAINRTASIEQRLADRLFVQPDPKRKISTH